MMISAKRYFRVYWSLLWRFWVTVFPIGTAFNIITARPQFDLFREWLRSEYYFDQAVQEALFEPTLRAISFAAVFITFAIFRALPRSLLKEEGSLFSSRQWSTIYVLFSIWELLLGSLNLLFVIQGSMAIWLLFWNSGMVLLMNCMFLAALTFVYINRSRVDEKVQSLEMPSVVPKGEWQYEEVPSAEGSARKLADFSPIDMEVNIPGGLVVSTKADKPKDRHEANRDRHPF
jgi:hypothetical protein